MTKIHFIAGFLFALVDTDLFLSELNVFTGGTVGVAPQTFLIYSITFTLYFLFTCKGGLLKAKPLWATGLLLATVLFVGSNILRLYFDGHLFRPSVYQDVRNIGILALIAIHIGNPDEDVLWLETYICGAAIALMVRVAVHFGSESKATKAILGVDIQSFYGTFGSHCVVVVAIACLLGISMIHERRFKIAVGLFVVAILFMIIIASGYRRMPIVRVSLVIIIGIIIAYWRLGKIAKIIPILVVTIVGGGLTIGCTLIGFYGITVTIDRLSSLNNPLDDNLSLESNKSYLDDSIGFLEVIKNNPIGVGYGNSYGIVRYIDSVIGSNESGYEIPIHVGFYEMIARSGVFGALVILALITATLAIARPLKKIQSSKNHILSAAIGCVFVYITFPFSAPQMSQIKIIATLGILIGLASRLQLGADWFRSRTLKVELVNHSSKLARDGCKRGTEAGTFAH